MEVSSTSTTTLTPVVEKKKVEEVKAEDVKESPVATDTVTLSEESIMMETMGTGGGGQKPPPSEN